MGATLVDTPIRGVWVVYRPKGIKERACLCKAGITRSPSVLHWLAYISVNAPISNYDRVSQPHVGKGLISWAFGNEVLPNRLRLPLYTVTIS